VRRPKGGMTVFRPESSHVCCNDQNELGNSGLIRRTRINDLRKALPAAPLVGGKCPKAFFLTMIIAFRVSRRPIRLPRKLQNLPCGKHYSRCRHGSWVRGTRLRGMQAKVYLE